ncbi:MAG: hypothetical protein QNJ60_12625 [Xenococcaceae cyanobacterium MO_188.B19]|nr:hypothetical protein [Xenococcaceae cyanobacterium MO_188.B19]
MNKILEITTLDPLIQSRHFISTLLRKLTKDKGLENLISFESLPEQYQMSAVVLWDCFLALKIEPHKLDGRIYFTAGNLKRLEQFIKRVEISWDCPYILETCYQAAKKSSSSFLL